jgi:hypothetical protein
LSSDGTPVFTGSLRNTQTFDIPTQPTYISASMQAMFVARSR